VGGGAGDQPARHVEDQEGERPGRHVLAERDDPFAGPAGTNVEDWQMASLPAPSMARRISPRPRSHHMNGGIVIVASSWSNDTKVSMS